MPEQTPTVGMERKLAAIFSTDVAGYSRLMGDDEAATIRTLTTYREVMTRLIQQHRGRVVDSPGDNLLAEFASAVDAVHSAVEIQHELKARNADLPEARKMEYRVGINVGDVVMEGERLYGDGVNIAARLESLAIPGGICISGTVYDQVKNKVALGYEYLGEQAVKNIADPVRVYRVVSDESSSHQVASQKSKEETPTLRWLRPAHRWVVAGLVLATVAIVAVRYLPFSLLSTRYSGLETEEAKPPSLPLPDKPSLIVLPFVNMSKDPDQEYFSDGLTDVLTGDLSKISSLFVIARNSAFTYKSKAVKMQEVGREMGVRYVLEGSVQKTDQRIRITAQLIEAATGYHLWSEQYDRPLTDIFALQDEIVQKIAATLKLQLTLQEQGFAERKHTDNMEAYDYFLRGRVYFWHLTKEANVQARQMYEQAVALDPQYAEAYARLGGAYWMEWVYRWNADPKNLERALEMAQRAVALDNALPLAHSFLSLVYIQKQQYDQALAEGERAIALNPNDAESRARQVEVLISMGRPEEALWLMQQAMRLNPRYPTHDLFRLGWAYGLTGQYTEAITALKEAASRNPNFFFTYTALANSYVLQWNSQQSQGSQTLEQALAAAQRAIALNDSLPWAHITLGTIYLEQKQYEQAITEVERATVLDPNSAFSYAALAVVLSSVGRSEKALRAAEQALRLKPLIVDYHLDSVGAAYYLAGRPEEAIAPLKQYLTRYPNTLGAHLTLAAVYSELGQTVEAQKEVAEVLRLNPKFSLEVHKQRMPIKDPAVLERHIAALRKVGLK